ncbi:MAG: hypothetical protein AAF611_02380 [Bacteroidota bacterium]
MMKKYPKITLLLVTALVLSACSNSSKTDWDLYELNGKVKTYLESYFEPVQKFGEWQTGKPQEFGNYSVTFTEDGTYKQMDFFEKNNKLRERVIAKQENGKVVEELKYNEDGDFRGKTSYTYLSDTKVEFVSYDENGEEIAMGKTYLKDGKIVRREFKTLYNGRIEYELRVKFMYDANGRSTAIEQSYGEGESKTTKFEYLEFDKQNNWTKRLDFVDDNTETPEKIVTRTYEYY